jgi:uracil-DNA glycosylase
MKLSPDELLLEIARCPLVTLNVVEEIPTHPCHDVVTAQWPHTTAFDRPDRWKAEHHLPTPWVGHLEAAPLLFVSSNPALASERQRERPLDADFAPPLERIGNHTSDAHPSLRHGLSQPKPQWKDDELVDRFSAAFDVWMVDGQAAVRDESGEAGKVTDFWRGTRELADAFFGGRASPGRDYALTEVVHCPSKKERGVRKAALTCGVLYLERVVALSPARVVVVLGDEARNAVRRVFAYPEPGRVSDPLVVARRKRRFVFLAHPSATRIDPRYPRCLPEDELRDLRPLLKA